MPNRYATPIEVPELRQKLWLLYQLKGGIEDDNAFGRLFRSGNDPSGITGKAVRYWVNGDDARGPNMVPADRFERFVEIFRKRLPGQRTTAETRALLMSATASPLKDAFFLGAPSVDWVTLVLTAKLGGVAIVPCGRRGVFNITSRGQALSEIAGQVDFELDHWFRLKLFDAEQGWLTLVQWGQSGWFGLEVADKEVSLEVSGSEIILPIKRPYFIEDEPGVRRYVFLFTPTPLPPDLLSKIGMSARAPVPLDAATLDRLAYVVNEVKAFKINAFDVRFVHCDETE